MSPVATVAAAESVGVVGFLYCVGMGDEKRLLRKNSESNRLLYSPMMVRELPKATHFTHMCFKISFTLALTKKVLSATR